MREVRGAHKPHCFRARKQFRNFQLKADTVRAQRCYCKHLYPCSVEPGDAPVLSSSDKGPVPIYVGSEGVRLARTAHRIYFVQSTIDYLFRPIQPIVTDMTQLIMDLGNEADPP